jgi:hypothetical protein
VATAGAATGCGSRSSTPNCTTGCCAPCSPRRATRPATITKSIAHHRRSHRRTHRQRQTAAQRSLKTHDKSQHPRDQGSLGSVKRPTCPGCVVQIPRRGPSQVEHLSVLQVDGRIPPATLSVASKICSPLAESTFSAYADPTPPQKSRPSRQATKPGLSGARPRELATACCKPSSAHHRIPRKGCARYVTSGACR